MTSNSTPSQEQPDTITRHDVYNKTLEQYVGGVTVGDKPSDADVKAQLKALGMGDHKYEVRKV